MEKGYNIVIIEKVISGGQTGADQAGLRAAKAFGLKTGGWLPLGCMTLRGSDPGLVLDYGLQEHPERGYKARTWANVRDSDGTIRFASNFNSPGEWCTLNAIKHHRKPYLDVQVPTRPPHGADWSTEALERFGSQIQAVSDWITDEHICVLNVAGNSDRTCPNIGSFVELFLKKVFETLKTANSA